MHDIARARGPIEAMIQSGDLGGLLRQAELIHGHLCPFVSLGVKAGHYAMTRLGVANTGMEELVAIVETNNCFTDGIQVVTGCTFGNNALIFKDLGKTAVTLARRQDGRALRLVVRPTYREELFARYPAAGPLFQKVVVERNATPEEEHHLHHIWPAMARKELERPLEEAMTVQELTITLPPYARIFASHTCARCGEAVMETRVRLVEGKPTCLACAGEDYALLTGQGISWSREA
uniref:Formylmethanofuran dehydrogenase n=1 Tax=Desulfobacca acetoxidans TaxID=60893 RepID=A0A7V4G6T9_9BACT